MFPELFTIFGFTIYTYGLMLALAYLTAIILAMWGAKRAGLDTKIMLDTAIIILISAIVGAKLFYIIGHLPEMLAQPSRLIDMFRAGGVFQGGLIVAAIAAIWFLARKKQPIWEYADVVAPAIALGQAIGRFGCFSAGCCYGKQCSIEEVPWAVKFGEKAVAAPPGVYLHPTQLYEMLLMLVVFALLMLLTKYKKFSGQVFWAYVVLHSIVRGGIVEWFRGDHGPVFLGLTGQQLISVFTLIAGIAFYLYLRSRSKEDTAHVG